MVYGKSIIAQTVKKNFLIKIKYIAKYVVQTLVSSIIKKKSFSKNSIFASKAKYVLY